MTEKNSGITNDGLAFMAAKLAFVGAAFRDAADYATELNEDQPYEEQMERMSKVCSAIAKGLWGLRPIPTEGGDEEVDVFAKALHCSAFAIMESECDAVIDATDDDPVGRDLGVETVIVRLSMN